MKSKELDQMVNRFVGWRIPKDFYPDGGISFVPPTFAGMWPTGTNLLSAEQARAMFAHTAAPLFEQLDARAGEIAHLKAAVDSYQWALAEANRDLKELVDRANRKWWQFRL